MYIFRVFLDYLVLVALLGYFWGAHVYGLDGMFFAFFEIALGGVSE